MNFAVSNNWVDCHFHVFYAGVAVPQARYVPRYDAPLSAWQSLAAHAGVTRGVLVQASFLGADNRRLVQGLLACPDRLRGVAVVAPDADVEVLWPLHAAGVRGLRLNLAQVSHDMDCWASARGLWDAMLALGWHLDLHTDRGALPGVLAAVPHALPLVVDHMARPVALSAHDPSIAAVVRRARQGEVHVKLSAPYRLGGHDPALLARLWLDELGASQLLWGSDWPWTNHEGTVRYPDLVSALHDWVGEEVVRAVLHDNPMQLYWDESG